VTGYREKITFTGTQETTLTTLWAKALDSRSPRPILGDRHADQAIQRIDYDFDAIKLSRRDEVSTALRSKAFDDHAARYIEAHPDCTVLHLGCGLDARAERVRPPATVRWYDIDLPDVVELRRRLYPDERDGYHTIGASVTDPELLDRIPGDKPVLVIAEGLIAYLPKEAGIAMLRRVTEHFPGGSLFFDAFNRLGLRVVRRFGVIKASGADVDWSIENPRELERAVPGLVFDTEFWIPDESEVRQYYPWFSRQLFRALFRGPLRRFARGLHYHFG
jgi:O-methyltransferase involved in polyketide biosynthesis